MLNMAAVNRQKLKIISWHINSILSIFDIKAFLDSFDADVICLQGTGITREEVLPYADVEGYNAYFSFCRNRGDDSGVATFCRNPFKPAEAEEGLTGLLPSCSNDAGIGNYCQSRMTFQSKLYLRQLDSDGRALVTSHIVDIEGDMEYIAVFNICAPRVDSKLDYHRILEIRINDLLEMGYFVIVAGDLNFAHRPIDHFDPGDSNIFLQHSARLWMSRFCNFQEMMQNSFNEGNESFVGIKLVDTFRLLHPFVENAFTYWPTTFARENNYGSRHDYFLVDNFIKPFVRRSEILTHITGSYHCPIKLILDVQRREELATVFPKLCSKYYPELYSKEYKLAAYSRANPRCPISNLQCHEINMNIDFKPSASESSRSNPGTSGTTQKEKKVTQTVKKNASVPYVPPFQELRVVSKTTGAVSYYRVSPSPAAAAVMAAASTAVSTYSSAPFSYTAAASVYTAASTYTSSAFNYSAATSAYASTPFNYAAASSTYATNTASGAALDDDNLSDTCSSLDSTTSSIDDVERMSFNLSDNLAAHARKGFHGRPVVEHKNFDSKFDKFGKLNSEPQQQDSPKGITVGPVVENTQVCSKFDKNYENLSIRGQFVEGFRPTFLAQIQHSENSSEEQEINENVDLLRECDKILTQEFRPSNKPDTYSDSLSTEDPKNSTGENSKSSQELNHIMTGTCSEEQNSHMEPQNGSLRKNLSIPEMNLICQKLTSMLTSDCDTLTENAIQVSEEEIPQALNSYNQERKIEVPTVSSYCAKQFKSSGASSKCESSQKLYYVLDASEDSDTAFGEQIEEESLISSPLAQGESTDIPREDINKPPLKRDEITISQDKTLSSAASAEINSSVKSQQSTSLSHRGQKEPCFGKKKGRSGKGKNWKRMKGHQNEHERHGDFLE